MRPRIEDDNERKRSYTFTFTDEQHGIIKSMSKAEDVDKNTLVWKAIRFYALNSPDAKYPEKQKLLEYEINHLISVLNSLKVAEIDIGSKIR